KEGIILSGHEIDQLIFNMAQAIIKNHPGAKGMVLIGIHTGGVFLANRLQARIMEEVGVQVPRGDIDISLYRDDWTRIGYHPVIQKTDITFSIDNKDAILVDDVLFTGRTVRAAMDALIDFGRPKRIELAVLIDRGHRELPIRASYSGMFMETLYDQTVNVYLKEISGRDEVAISRP
ncbi:MAG: bifunctional pyr operon transcriptional regulator/uracil phosphoribosyltransferase PyrR, partial [Pseudomonadota bacterium]